MPEPRKIISLDRGEIDRRLRREQLLRVASQIAAGALPALANVPDMGLTALDVRKTLAGACVSLAQELIARVDSVYADAPKG